MKYGSFIKNPGKQPPLEGINIPHEMLWAESENPQKFWVMDTDARPWAVKHEGVSESMAERIVDRLNAKAGRERYQVLGFGIENPKKEYNEYEINNRVWNLINEGAIDKAVKYYNQYKIHLSTSQRKLTHSYFPLRIRKSLKI